jgi:hypothetical protein
MLNRTTCLIAAATLLGCLSLAGVASARYYVPEGHQRCRINYVRKTVKVKDRTRHGRLVKRHGKVVWVRQARCFSVAHAKPVTSKPAPPVAPAPTISYQADVDPSFVQAANNPLAVTYQYSADATATSSVGTRLDLAAADELPDGILNFYSPAAPGQPAGLVCSINVGGPTSGGSCSITYPATGAYQVTTQYIPNGESAVTVTDVATISPYTTSTVQQLSAGSASIAVTPQVLDQNGNPPAAQQVQVSVYDTRTGDTLTLSGTGALTLSEHDVGQLDEYLTGAFAGAPASEPELGAQSGDTLQVTTSYAGTADYGASASPTEQIAVP